MVKLTEDKLIPIEEIAKVAAPGTVVPDNFHFSYDNKYLAYLYSPGSDLNRQLWIMNLKTAEKKLLFKVDQNQNWEENLTLEEKLRRERQRKLITGITHMEWAKNINRLVFDTPEGIFLADFTRSEVKISKILDKTGISIIDPQISPDGKWLAYVKDGEIFINGIENKSIKQITLGATENGKTNGLAEYIAQEEMRRNHGFWWSPDSTCVAFVEVDESHIPIYRTDAHGEGFRYPFAGDQNARIRLGVVEIAGGNPTWINLGENDDIYLARVQWLSDTKLAFQIQNRGQTKLDLNIFDKKMGKSRNLISETTDVWINLHNMLYSLKSKSYNDKFLWVSERTGFNHLYLYNFNGDCIKELTAGEFLVKSIVGVNEEQGRIYFTATINNPIEVQLCSVSLSGEDFFIITDEPGIHDIVMDNKQHYYVDTFSSIENPPTVKIRTLEDKPEEYIIFNEEDPRIKAFDLKPPKLITIQALDGTKLYGAIYQPSEEFQPPYPTLISVYGGPGAQFVQNSWMLTAGLRIQNLRKKGFLVMVLDNRGSTNRGLKFEGVLKNELGNIEVQDQITGVKWLIDQGLSDKNRIGIFGWSYGGYMSIMCLAKAPELFKIALAGAPVTDCAGYDTHYTERYLGTPQNNPEGYKKSNVMHYIKKMTGKLLLIHGMLDENVHFQHTIKLINTLIREQKPYDLLLFPQGRHSLRKPEDRIYLEKKLIDYFSKEFL